ncbi:uncharacterized protein LOC117333750 [Pecten maximus]|uniref:uncharacterized protein LOC117333750 n=1 Tax=Pecten maximus TaxID=6579 RepID=UPI001458ED63|nr:uncharacterized protein LOC117333750 [Pecten maximus]
MTSYRHHVDKKMIMMTSWVIDRSKEVGIVFILIHVIASHPADRIGDFLVPEEMSDDISIHGGVKMGVLDNNCDNGKDRLYVDLAHMDEMMRICPARLSVPQCRHRKRGISATTQVSCKKPAPICTKHADRPLHECMDKAIVYKEPVPTSGAHRPIWPVYGEYYYIPPQRWIHSLEHGAAVFLYHPCADLHQLDIFRSLATTCLRRHIITPYNLTQTKPFAILTWTCRLMLDRVDIHIPAAVDFIRSTALDTYESKVYQDGQYSFLLKTPAGTVTDKRDLHVCPSYRPTRRLA